MLSYLKKQETFSVFLKHYFLDFIKLQIGPIKTDLRHISWYRLYEYLTPIVNYQTLSLEGNGKPETILRQGRHNHDETEARGPLTQMPLERLCRPPEGTFTSTSG